MKAYQKTWPKATRDRPCPHCGKPNKCRIAPDGLAVYCWREEGGKVVQLGGNGYCSHERANGNATRHDKSWRKSSKNTQAYDTPDAAIAAAGVSIPGDRGGVWHYHDAAGDHCMSVARWNLPDGSKEFRPVHLRSERWYVGDPPGLLPLYCLPDLPATGPIYICEGEKAVDAARTIGLEATTSAHGSGSAGKSDWTVLAARDVVILPDNDEAGEKYARDVATRLVKLDPPARVKSVRLPGLPAGGDVVEYIGARPGQAPDTIRAEVEALVVKAPELSPGDLVGGPLLTCMADVEAKEVAWLWPGRIPLGRLSLLVGRPGEGKSFLALDMAARVATGTPWPDGSECPKGSVILICAEDDPGDTIKPRLEALGADCSKVHLLSAVRRIDAHGKRHDVLFTLADVAALEAALRAHPDCRLIVVDPIGSFLGGDTDAHRDNVVRGVLAPVARLAEEYGAAVLVVAHRRKSAGSNADDLALGSRAFTGIARAVWHLSRDSENKARRLLLPGKNNLAPEGNGMAFTICGDPPAIAWERDPVAMSADDALAVENGNGDEAKPGPEPEALNAAKQWLAKLLEDGEVEAAKVKAEAKDAGLAWRTVQRAADALGVIREKNAFNGGWQWRLPKHGSEDANGRCQALQEQENLASWHLGKNQGKNGNSLCQDSEDAKSSNLGVLDSGDAGRKRGQR